jgi:MoxR-like ATPase
MSPEKLPYQHVPEAPTRPRDGKQPGAFDVADLYRGPVAAGGEKPESPRLPLDEKLRQAYFWIINHAIISPHYDIEYNTTPPQQFTFGDSQTPVSLPTDQSYSSFILVPLLNFAVRRRCLFIGGPGRGKTSSAVLMSLLAGYSLQETRRAMMHGQPQMTISDLLGNPLPADLVNAQQMDDIRISWRAWLGMRVKIIDEYNRIPTRTQSALLTVMADDYAELLDHIYECPPAAWYLTANDDIGGGTYPVIEALRDRIDVVVKALSFNHRFLDALLQRIESGIRPEEVMPRQIIFTRAETEVLNREILSVDIPQPVQRRLEFFASQFEFSEPAAKQLEYMTKDTARLSGLPYHQITAMETGKDRLKDVGAQTINGLSVRGLMTVLIFAKALAFFRGSRVVSLEDLRQILPFCLHDKLKPDKDAPFFDLPGNTTYLTDTVGWIRHLFDLACAEYDRLDLDQTDPVRELNREFRQGLDGLDAGAVRQRLVNIERILGEWSQGRKLYGHLYEDILALKYLHQRYTNYLNWLETGGEGR